MKKLLLLTAVTAFSFFSCEGSKQLPADDSILWKVSGNGLENPSYMLGTHHFAPLAVLDGYPAYLEGLESAVKVVGELDMSLVNEVQALMMREGSLPEGTTYHDLLTDEEYAKLDEKLIENFGVGLTNLGSFKPSMISNMLVAMTYVKANPSFSPLTHIPIDTYMQNLGIEQGKEIIGLETGEEQIELLVNFEPLDVQAKSLLCMIENDDDSVDLLKKMDELYREGRLREMYEFSFDKANDPCPFSEEFEAAILRIRNEKWMVQLPGIMAEGPAFVAVGALHLAGEQGLIEQLRRLGYTVEPIR